MYLVIIYSECLVLNVKNIYVLIIFIIYFIIY